MNKRLIWSALVHYPVLDKEGNIVTTSVTNMDVHDISRTARTFGLSGVYIITPIEIHRIMVSKVVSLWQNPEFYRRTPSRQEALSLVEVAGEIAEVKDIIHKETGKTPFVIGTTRKHLPSAVSYEEMRNKIFCNPQNPILILFGTGWGLAPPALDSCDCILTPIEGFDGYAHLSVRSAAAIILDRLLGR